MWLEVSQDLQRQIHSARTADDIVRAILGEAPSARPWPAGLVSRLLHPAGSVGAVLALPRRGMRALDLGTGWPALASALGSFGVTVTSADAVSLRMKFEQLMHDEPSGAMVKLGGEELGPTGSLPWPDASFERVFTDVAELEHAGADIARTLAEIRRVLTADGIVVTALSRQAKLSTRWLRRLLTDAGLVLSKTFIARPRQDDWTRLVPQRAFRQQLLNELRDEARASVWSKQMAKRALAFIGAVRHFPRDEYLIARRSSLPDSSPLSALLPESGSTDPIILSLSDARVALVGEHSFVKLPLSVHQQQAIVQEAENTRLARATAFAPYVVNREYIGEHHGVRYVRYPLLTHKPLSNADAGPTIADILRTTAPSAAAPLHATEFWKRLRSDRAKSDAADVGAGALRERVLVTLGHHHLPAGPTHGDLHTDNVLVTDDSFPVLVDWNRFELLNPLVLDAGYAAIEHHRRATGCSLAHALTGFRQGMLDGPLAEHAYSLLAGLTRGAAAALILLDRIVSYSLPRRRHKPWTMAPLQDAVEAITTETA